MPCTTSYSFPEHLILVSRTLCHILFEEGEEGKFLGSGGGRLGCCSSALCALLCGMAGSSGLGRTALDVRQNPSVVKPKPAIFSADILVDLIRVITAPRHAPNGYPRLKACVVTIKPLPSQVHALHSGGSARKSLHVHLARSGRRLREWWSVERELRSASCNAKLRSVGPRDVSKVDCSRSLPAARRRAAVRQQKSAFADTPSRASCHRSLAGGRWPRSLPAVRIGSFQRHILRESGMGQWDRSSRDRCSAWGLRSPLDRRRPQDRHHP